jgi:hypothetical protein
MPRTRTIDRTPEERLRIGRWICGGGQVLETAACIALLFFLTWPTNVIVAVIGFTMTTAYNILLWHTIKKEADRRAAEDSNPYNVL